MDKTARFGLPLLAAGQAQKELFHNEGLTLVDALLHACVEAIGDNEPPMSAERGAAWIVGTAPTGDWSGRDGYLAVWSDGGWRFVAPREGMTVTLRTDGLLATRRGESWIVGGLNAAGLHIGGNRVVGFRQPPIGDPSDGETIDVEARDAISSILNALREHGLIAD